MKHMDFRAAVHETMPCEMRKNQAPDTDCMRDLAMRIAHEKDMRDQIPNIRIHLSATNEIVRIAAINALGQFRDEESRAAIEAALRDGSPRIQRAARTALNRYDASAKSSWK